MKNHIARYSVAASSHSPFAVFVYEWWRCCSAAVSAAAAVDRKKGIVSTVALTIRMFILQ